MEISIFVIPDFQWITSKVFADLGIIVAGISTKRQEDGGYLVTVYQNPKRGDVAEVLDDLALTAIVKDAPERSREDDHDTVLEAKFDVWAKKRGLIT